MTIRHALVCAAAYLSPHPFYPLFPRVCRPDDLAVMPEDAMLTVSIDSMTEHVDQLRKVLENK